MTSIRFNVHWHGELAAGIRPGYENVVLTFEYTDSIDTDTLEYWREAVRDYYDGATVETQEESIKRIIATGTCPGCGHRIHDPGECQVGHTDNNAVNTFGYPQEYSCECQIGKP